MSIHVLDGKSIRKFGSTARAIEAYPQIKSLPTLSFENEKARLLNVRPLWLIIPDSTETKLALMDSNHEIRTVATVEDVLYAASKYASWKEVDEVKQGVEYEAMAVNLAKVSSEILDFNDFLKVTLMLLEEIHSINSLGGPGSRKVVDEKLDSVVMNVRLEQNKVKLILEAL